MIKNEIIIHDQYTDRSGTVLTKIAARLSDSELGEQALAMLYSMDRPSYIKTASFPTDTPEDTLLSRIYFEGQRDKLTEKVASEIDERIGVSEIIHHMNPDVSFLEMRKEAQEMFELMPDVYVSTEEDLIKIGEEFSSNYNDLAYTDRIVFSKNFCKLAEELPPVDVRVYAVEGVQFRDDAADQMHFRKLAADRCGKDGTCYELLADDLRNLDKDTCTYEEMSKLADLVHSMDAKFGFTDRTYDRRLPDAWHALFKGAEENAAKEIKTKEMSKADIIAQYGEDALDEVENADGSINHDRLSQIVKMFGGDTHDDNDKLDKPAE